MSRKPHLLKSIIYIKYWHGQTVLATYPSYHKLVLVVDLLPIPAMSDLVLNANISLPARFSFPPRRYHIIGANVDLLLIN
jgi:hypothetical protein